MGSSYKAGRYTDVEIACSNSMFHCHQLILGSISEMFSNVLPTSNDELLNIIMPDCREEDVKAFIESIYDFMVQGGRTKEISINKMFGINFYSHSRIMDLSLVDYWDVVPEEIKSEPDVVINKRKRKKVVRIGLTKDSNGGKKNKKFKSEEEQNIVKLEPSDNFDENETKPYQPGPNANNNQLKDEEMCHFCGEVFECITPEQKRKYSRHKKYHKDRLRANSKKTEMDMEKAGGFVCCDKIYKTKSSIADHVSTVHTPEKFVKCELCHVVGTILGVIKHKELTHAKEGNSEFPFVCETCGKAFKTRGNIENHKMIHRVYRCDICGEDIFGNNAFKTHKKNVHGDKKKDKTSTCQVCGLEFRNLQKHFLTRHVDEKDHPYQCEDCERRFPTKYRLSCHQMMAHIKSRPYKCRYGCGVAYNDSGSLSSHESKKHGGPFSDERMTKNKKSI